MAIGGFVANPSLALTLSGVLTWACIVDGHVNVSPSTPLTISQTGTQPAFFTMPCAQCGRNYLIEVTAPMVSVSVQQTSP